MNNRKFVLAVCVYLGGMLVCVFGLGCHWSWALCSIEPKAVYEILQPNQPAKSLAFTILSQEKDPQELHLTVEYWQKSATLPVLKNWLKVSPGILTVNPGTTQTAHLQIQQVPLDQQEVLVMLYISSTTATGAINLNLREGIPCYFLGSAERLTRVAIDGLEFRENRGTLTISNIGTVHVMPFGDILLKKNGKIIASQPYRFDEPVFSHEQKSRSVLLPPEYAAADEAEAVVLYYDAYSKTEKLEASNRVFQLKGQKK